MYMCIEASIKECYKVTISQPQLLIAQTKKQSYKLRDLLDLREDSITSKKSLNTVHTWT